MSLNGHWAHRVPLLYYQPASFALQFRNDDGSRDTLQPAAAHGETRMKNAVLFVGELFV